MYSGGSHKFGRGRGGGGGSGGSKRQSFPPPPHHRQSTPSSASRLSLGGSGSNSRSRTPSSSAPSPLVSQQTADESFRLVRSEPPSLAAIIRLTPDLVDEIRRVEAQGGAARMKFDSNPNNPGNVIDVGGKEYRFTWADEKHCDIYEERQGGEDGNGLLVETGYVWRKLTVQRVLDESTKKHVKMRSLECQQTHKSRKAIILEPGNPSMKSQVKALAAAEASPWKHKQKDLQFKKKIPEPPQGGGPAKPVHRSGPSTTPAKGRLSTSPLPSPQNQYISLTSPSARQSADESRSIDDPTTTQARADENAKSLENILLPRVSGTMNEGAPHRDSHEAGAVDSQDLLITLLKDNPKGMSLKALEKAVGDVTSSSARRIELILKKIATYESSGRYKLKPGIEVGAMKSSPEDNHPKQFVPKNIYGGVPASDSGSAEKSPADYMKEQVPLNNKFEGESNMVENMDPSQHLTDLFGDDEPPRHSEGQAVSSSNSDSDTGSGSSDGGTNSASQSRSRSPAGSASASSSDSEADSSPNSKDASDVEVDILGDGYKEPTKLLDTEHGLSDTPMPWGLPEPRPDGNDVDQDGYASEDVDIENDFLGDNEVQLATASHDRGIPRESNKIVSRDQQQIFGSTDETSEQEYAEDKFKHERSGSILSSENNSKRGLNVVHMEENTDSPKRFKGRSMAHSSVSGYMGSHTLHDQGDNHNLQMANQFKRDDKTNGNIGEDRGPNYLVPGKSNVESLQSGRRPPVRTRTTESADKPAKEMNSHAQEDILKKGDKNSIEMRDEEGSSNEKTDEKFKESPYGQKPSMQPEPLHKHQSARSKKSSDSSKRRNSGSSAKDSTKANFEKSPIDGRRLQRELSDLEVGEFREPLAEAPDLSKKTLERVGSFKQSEAKLGSDSRNTYLKAITANQPPLDLGNASIQNLKGITRKTDDVSNRRSLEPYSEDATRPQNGMQSQQQQSRSGRVEVEPLSNTFANQGADVEGYGETQRKSYENAPRDDSQQNLESRKGKGNKSRKSKAMADGDDKKRDVSVGRTGKRKRNESSSDENASYSKYEKEEPELKGPIKSFSQYKEYIQEYNDKYDSYCSLNKKLENYRNEFQKLGLDLDSAKGRDMERYYSILAQLRESYRQCGTRHKQLKKVFIVLHEELKHLKQKIKDFVVDYMRD